MKVVFMLITLLTIKNEAVGVTVLEPGKDTFIYGGSERSDNNYGNYLQNWGFFGKPCLKTLLLRGSLFEKQTLSPKL